MANAKTNRVKFSGRRAATRAKAAKKSGGKKSNERMESVHRNKRRLFRHFVLSNRS
jgi:hypothetical protein